MFREHPVLTLRIQYSKDWPYLEYDVLYLVSINMYLYTQSSVSLCVIVIYREDLNVYKVFILCS